MQFQSPAFTRKCQTVLYSTLLRIAMDSLSFSTSPWKQCLWHNGLHCCVQRSIHRSNLGIWYPMIMSAWLCHGWCSWIDHEYRYKCPRPGLEEAMQMPHTTTVYIHMHATHFFYRIFHCLFENVVFPIPRASNVTKRTHSWANKGSQIATTIPRFGAPKQVEWELKLTKTPDTMESEVKKEDLSCNDDYNIVWFCVLGTVTWWFWQGVILMWVLSTQATADVPGTKMSLRPCMNMGVKRSILGFMAWLHFLKALGILSHQRQWAVVE